MELSVSRLRGWQRQRGLCVRLFFPWELKASGFAKAQEEVRMSSQACRWAASLPLPISSYPKCFHPSFSSHPSQLPPRTWVLLAGRGCRLFWGDVRGCCGREDRVTDLGTDSDLCSPSNFALEAEEREGGVGEFGTLLGREGECCIKQTQSRTSCL